MRFNGLQYCRRKIAAFLSRMASVVENTHSDDGAGPTNKQDPGVLIGIDRGKLYGTDNFVKKYSLRRFLLVLALCILLAGFLLKYLFIVFPQLNVSDMPLLGSIILTVLLSPALYTIFYRPMIAQINKLRTAEVKMREFAHYDALTGLYNRRGFLTFADQLLQLSDRAQRGFILIYADMDNLKDINDERGHEEGDRALKTIGEVLQNTFRKSDIITRVGGDEFAILAVEAKTESLDALRKRLNKNLENTAYNVGSANKLTFSLGILYYDPDKQRSIDRLLNSADMLMYEEKRIKSMSSPVGLSPKR